MTIQGVMTDAERADRGRRADDALAEFVGPACDTLEAEYAERVIELSASTPWETSKIAALAAGIRVARQVRAQMIAIIADGKDAQAGRDRVNSIEKLSPARRRILGL